jgi:hypothetical protein
MGAVRPKELESGRITLFSAYGIGLGYFYRVAMYTWGVLLR